MKRLICATLCGVLLGGTVLASASPAQSKARKHGKHEPARAENNGAPDVSVRVVFASGEVTILRNHYAPRYRNLPKGLQKKVARGGELPPGWQKKFEPFPVAVERRLSPLPAGYRRGVLDGHAVIYNSRTNVVIDVAVLF